MKKYTRILSCFLIVACMASFFCIPAFAATGDLSDGSMGQILPLANPERQKTQNFDYSIYSAATGNLLITLDMTVTGMWSQVEHSAYMTNATCTISGPIASSCSRNIRINGNQTMIDIYENGVKCLTFTFTIYTNGNIKATFNQTGSSQIYVLEY